jgi:F0F1-type ATP synthase gamma subunit
MQAAERSIEARVDGLTGHLRRERQRQITEEVLDIASGYRSVVGPGP